MTNYEGFAELTNELTRIDHKEIQSFMSLEIERKFLVKCEAWRGLAEPVRIRQGYVATKDGTTVRVRVAGDLAL